MNTDRTGSLVRMCACVSIYENNIYDAQLFLYNFDIV